jgi:sulfur relay (sulfurtransferase) complex TusBCD TusD component (DsrE family)
MSPRPRTLGILLSSLPDQAGFRHGLGLAQAALARGIEVYLYCLDDAVLGVADPALQSLRARGLRLYACAYGARRRGLPLEDQAVFAGLGVLNDLISATDRFVSFS